MEARDGDHLLIPFECDVCVFRKLRGSSPLVSSPKDRLLLASIRRVNLDAFWSRATSTVKANKNKVALGIKLSETVGLSGPYVHHEDLPNRDHCGYEVAVQMVLYSRRPGKHQVSYTQFDTVRKLRSAFSNHVRASPSSNQGNLSLGDQSGKYQRLTEDACGSLWFQRFVEGCRNRMGQDWRPNRALPTEMIITLLERVTSQAQAATSEKDKNKWIVFHTLVTLGYSLSLRGTEVFLTDLAGLYDLNKNQQDKDHFFVTLLGKVKGERHHRQHALPCGKETGSRIQIYDSVMRLVRWKHQSNIKKGPAISDQEGKLFQRSIMDDCLHEILEEMFDDEPAMFPPDIRTKDKLRSSYQVFRTFRRSSDTRALDKGVDTNDVNAVNRWRKKESAQGKKPAFDMAQHYAQAEYLTGPFVRYTSAM